MQCSQFSVDICWCVCPFYCMHDNQAHTERERDDNIVHEKCHTYFDLSGTLPPHKHSHGFTHGNNPKKWCTNIIQIHGIRLWVHKSCFQHWICVAPGSAALFCPTCGYRRRLDVLFFWPGGHVSKQTWRCSQQEKQEPAEPAVGCFFHERSCHCLAWWCDLLVGRGDFGGSSAWVSYPHGTWGSTLRVCFFSRSSFYIQRCRLMQHWMIPY